MTKTLSADSLHFVYHHHTLNIHLTSTQTYEGDDVLLLYYRLTNNENWAKLDSSDGGVKMFSSFSPSS